MLSRPISGSAFQRSWFLRLLSLFLLHLSFHWGQSLPKLLRVFPLRLGGVDLTSLARCQEQVLVDLGNFLQKFLREFGAVDGHEGVLDPLVIVDESA